MNKVKLGDIAKVRTGKLDANAADPNGRYPFFTCAAKELRIDTAAYDCECVLVAGNGDLNVKYYKGAFNAYQRTYIIESRDSTVLQVPYLYRFLCYYVDILRTQSIGGVIKYIKLGNLTEAKIPLFSTDQQEMISSLFRAVDHQIQEYINQIQRLDMLVKSRFIEMFGNPNTNREDMQRFRIGEFATVKGGNTFKTEYQGCKDRSLIPFYKVSDMNNLGNEKQMTESNNYISPEVLKAGCNATLHPSGTVIFPKVGMTISTNKKRILGTLAAIDNNLMAITVKTSNVDPMYLYEYFNHFVNLIDLASSANPPSINAKTVQNYQIVVPNIIDQQVFVSLVNKVDKSKFAIQKAIDKLELLKASLMQEYFG